MEKKVRVVKWFGLLLALVMVFANVPAEVMAAEPASPLQGKTISILGDSISTFAGTSNNTEVNATLSGSAVFYTPGTLGVHRADTWWQQTSDNLGMEVLVNNSWSGSCIFNARSGTVGAYVDRCVQLHHDKTGREPDIIAVYLGTNDFCNYKNTLGTAAQIDYAALIAENNGSYIYAAPATATEAYAIMLHKMMERYPDAEVYCLTLLPQINLSAANVLLMEQFNESIRQIADHFGAYTVDLYANSGVKADGNFQKYVSDNSLHPGPAGMDAITGCLISSILNNSRHVTGSVHQISYELTNAIVDQGTAGAVLDADTFSCSFTAPQGCLLDVCVTMGGTGVTMDCYADGKITIPAVTGDVVIRVSAGLSVKELLGDVNRDGHVDSLDTNILYRHTNNDTSLAALSSVRLTLADVNRDGYVDSLDTNILYRYAGDDSSLTWVPVEAEVVAQ